MVEDTKDAPPSQESSEAEKKPAPQPAAPTRPTAPVQASAAARPVVPPSRPPTPAAQPPPSQPPRNTGRRTFIKALVAVSAVLAIIPFVPWGNFLFSSVSSSGAYQRQKAVLDLNTSTNRNANGTAAGKTVNVKDLASFPPNGSWLITYPSSGDLTIDSQNPDTFQKFTLIRLPEESGGSNTDASAFVAFSKVCVHLWCSPNYNSAQTKNPNENGYQSPSNGGTTHEQYECPCHGSIYEIPDGKAVLGPASLQAFPTNSIPMLTLTADPNGDLYIEPPVFDIEHNGVIGYGRDSASYQNYILPVAEGKVKP
jgi:Rieske Fe-S protein